MTENLESLTPTEFFNHVKTSKEATIDEDLKRYYANTLRMLSKAIKTGQKRQIALLRHHVTIIQREQKIRAKGVNTFVYTDDVSNYIEHVENRCVKLADLDEFPREIPDEVIPIIIEMREQFDRLIIMFTDYTDDLGKQVAQDKRDKDPILFGVFLDEAQKSVTERMYFLADWEDEYCDLTLDKLIEESKELDGTDIAYYCEEVNVDELLTLADNYNEELIRTSTKYKQPNKKPPFSKIRNWLKK